MSFSLVVYCSLLSILVPLRFASENDFRLSFKLYRLTFFSSIWETFENEWMNEARHTWWQQQRTRESLIKCRKSLVMRLEKFIIILISLLSSRRWCQLTQALEKKELIRRWRWSVIFIVREINENFLLWFFLKATS